MAALAMNDTESPGEVPWPRIEKFFGESFKAMQQAAMSAAQAKLHSIEEEQRRGRQKMARFLREDAESYRKDRLAEIDREEKEAKLALDKDGQQLLFKGHEPTGFKAKRAAVETFHQRRLKEIEEFERAVEPPPLQPLGVLFVFPREGGNAA